MKIEHAEICLLYYIFYVRTKALAIVTFIQFNKRILISDLSSAYAVFFNVNVCCRFYVFLLFDNFGIMFVVCVQFIVFI